MTVQGQTDYMLFFRHPLFFIAYNVYSNKLAPASGSPGLSYLDTSRAEVAPHNHLKRTCQPVLIFFPRFSDLLRIRKS